MANKNNKNAEDYRGVLAAPVTRLTTVSTAPAAAKNAGRIIYLSLGGTGSVPCLAISDGTNWKQVAIGANAI